MVRSSYIAAVIVAFLTASPAVAGPYGLSYGGRLTDGQGAGVVGPVDLEVSFFRTATGGSALSPSPIQLDAVPLSNGIFQISLSTLSDAERNQIFSASDELWIEIRDVTHNHTMPRQSYAAVPYALKVPVDGNSIIYNADGALTLGTVAGGAGSGANSDITALNGLTTAITVAQGGTNATSASGARTNLGAAASGANSDITALNGLTSAINVAHGGTGATNAGDARVQLGAASSGANTDITSLAALSTTITVAQGGTGAATALGARTNLGLGSAALLQAGTGPDQLVQLNGSGQLPAVSGMQLTAINAASLYGDLPAISGANLTNLQAASLTGTLPAVSGASLTGLNATNITSGNLPLAQLPTGTDGDILYYDSGWKKLAAGSAGQVLGVTSGLPSWVSVTPDTSYTKRRMSYFKNAGATTVATLGFAAVPTLSTTATSADDADGPQLMHTTAASSGTASGVISTAFTIVRRDWDPEYVTTIKTDAINTSLRYWVGFFSANIDAVTVPTSQHVAAFRYDTGADGTTYWRTVTNDGAGPATVTTTTAAVAPATEYRLRVACTTSDCKFYVNNVLVSVHTTTLPATTSLMGFGNRVTTLLAAARTIRWGRIEVLHE